MKKIILLLTTAILLYVSGSALEPVRIGMNYPTGANFKVQLVDYTDPGNPIQKYPLVPNTFFETNLIPNTSGVVSFVVGEGDPDWGGIMPNQINENVVIDVRVGNNLVAQFDFLEMITTQAATGNGNILNDGFTSSGGVTFSDTSNITNDFLFGSAKLDRLSSVDETKFFFDHSKAAFRTGIVGTDSWNENNLGNFSFAAGKDTKASGVGAVALGVGTTAPSYGEVAIGSYNTVYVPGSTSAIDNTDRAFVIGNGTAGTPSDAFIIQKNGNMTVGGSLTVLGATITNSALVVGGTTIDPNTGNLVVAGTTTMNGNASVTGANTFTVGTGATTLGGTLTSTGLVTANAGVTVTGANLTVGSTNIDPTNGNTVVGGTLDVTGLLSADGGIDVDGTFTVADATGNTAVGGTLTSTGLVTANAGVTITGANLTVGTTTVDPTNGNTTVGGTLTSTGLVTANAGATVAGANLTVGTTTVDPTNGNTTVGGTLTSTGLVTANAGATITGANLTVGTTTVDPANGNTTVGGTLTSTGLVTANAGATVAGANLTVGTTTVDPTNGNTTVGGMLSQGFISIAAQADLSTVAVNVIEYTDNVDVANVDLPAVSGTVLYINCTQAIANFLGTAINAGEVVTVANFNGTWKIVSIN